MILTVLTIVICLYVLRKYAINTNEQIKKKIYEINKEKF